MQQLRSTQAAITGTNHHNPSVHRDFGLTEPGTVRDTEKLSKKEAFWKTDFQCPEFGDSHILTMVTVVKKWWTMVKKWLNKRWTIIHGVVFFLGELDGELYKWLSRFRPAVGWSLTQLRHRQPDAARGITSQGPSESPNFVEPAN